MLMRIEYFSLNLNIFADSTLLRTMFFILRFKVVFISIFLIFHFLLQLYLQFFKLLQTIKILPETNFNKKKKLSNSLHIILLTLTWAKHFLF